MPYVADLHIHSRFARACSGALNIPNLAKWAKFKGIDLVGTGDCLHPLWQAELKKDLVEVGDGTYEFQGDRGVQGGKQSLPADDVRRVRFILTAEVACIYTEGGKSRRIHTLIFLPSLESVAKLSEAMRKRGLNLSSDGRPIFGISSKQLCDLVFTVEPKAIIIPAHIWTPWFSLYGSNSGYDKFSDCYGDFSDQIYAVETGLSSEPAMNWRIKDLDHKSIVSFSDLHSLPRLGREVTLFSGNLGYSGLLQALKDQAIIGTIEFFPEEGKYHYSGHRNCNVVLDPTQLKDNGKICPVCKRPLTIGVMQRIEDLASRSEAELELEKINGVTRSKKFPDRPGFRMLVQLEEILAEAMDSTVSSQKVKAEYERLVTTLDSELKILTKTPIDLISMTAGEKVAEGVKKVRAGEIHIEPGYDNTYGVVKIWTDETIQPAKEQISLF